MRSCSTCGAMNHYLRLSTSTYIYTRSLHDALPILRHGGVRDARVRVQADGLLRLGQAPLVLADRSIAGAQVRAGEDRKSTRLNSSHSQISYAVFCLKKKKNKKKKQMIKRRKTNVRV